jgi:hypothetical protein
MLENQLPIYSMVILRWCEKCRTLSLLWSVKCPFCFSERNFNKKVIANKRKRQRDMYNIRGMEDDTNGK